jgi:hypothetical protein
VSVLVISGLLERFHRILRDLRKGNFIYR